MYYAGMIMLWSSITIYIYLYTYIHIFICAYIARFVGWLKNFVHNRSLADENLMRGYCAATITRSMPWQVMSRVHARAMGKSKDAAGPCEMFVRHQAEKGTGEVIIKQTKHNSRKRDMADFPKLREALLLLRRKGLLTSEDQEMPTHMQLMKSGISINGTKWTSDMAAAYSWTANNGPGGEMRIGVLKYFCLVDVGVDEEDGLFMMVEEHRVVGHCHGVVILKKEPRRELVCFPVHCLTYVMSSYKPPGDRPEQGHLEGDEDYNDRLKRPWNFNRGHLWALTVAPAF